MCDRTYWEAHNEVGDAGLVDATAILGYYSYVAMTLNVFGIEPPPAK